MTMNDAAELASRNLSWMIGNTFLAWSAVLFALHLRGTPRQHRGASAVLVLAVPTMLAARLGVRHGFHDRPVHAVALVILVGSASALWSWRTFAGDRWARVVGYVGVLAFAPNAPYILTDLFHHIQDVRLAAFGFGASSLFAFQYGWFLTFGAASWIALLVLARDWLWRHRPRWHPIALLVPACGLMAFGIYLGRIERFHSWHPLQDPGRFADRVVRALMSPGPLSFTFGWWIVVLLVGVAGVRLHDRARAAGSSSRSLIVGVSWALTGALLAGTPLIDDAYRAVGVDAEAPSRSIGIACLLVGVVASSLAGLRLSMLLSGARGSRPWTPRRMATWAAVASIVIPLVGCALTAASVAQWYMQFRGLCEYGPDPNLHGDSCPD